MTPAQKTILANLIANDAPSAEDTEWANVCGFVLPSVEAVTVALFEQVESIRAKPYDLDDDADDEPHHIDARIQATSKNFAVHVGPSDYDQDHKGSWGASSVDLRCADRLRECLETARELIRDLLDSAAELDEDERTDAE